MMTKSASPDDRMVSANRRCSSDKAVSHKSSAMPTTPFIGVRISWDILARKADFARFAASASARAASSAAC